jgi:hypothetical protein
MNRPLALLLLSLPLTAAAQIYKWTDANGQVHYSQNPPAQGNYKDVSPDLPPLSGAAGPVAPGKRAAQSGGGGGGSSSGGQALQAKADNAERCAKAHERITYLQQETAHRLFVTGDDGQPARMTDEQFDTQMKDSQEAADKYCAN